MWATRKARYGSRGEATPRQLSEYCGRGHRLTPDNLYWKANRHGTRVRQCKACHRAYEKHVGRVRRRLKRNGWHITRDGTRVLIAAHNAFYTRERAKLRATLMASHPDRGGSETAFREALRAYRKFEAREQKWYAAVGADVPRNAAAAAEQP
jgi:hypothetical protein